MAGPEFMPEPNAPTGSGPRIDTQVSPGIDYRRIQQPPELTQPWHIPQSGREQEAEALSRAFDTFGKEAGEWGSKLAKQAGAAAGAPAGAQPGFQPKTGLAAASEYGTAYNAAAHVTYSVAQDANIEDAISKAELANPHDPIAFAQQAQAARDGILKETPELYQPDALVKLNYRIAAGHARIADETMKWNQTQAVDAYTTSRTARIQTAVRDAAALPDVQATALVQQAVADDANQRAGLVKNGVWSQDHSDAAGQEFQNAATQAMHTHYAASVAGRLLDQAKAGDVDGADRALLAYMQDKSHSPEDVARVTEKYESDRAEWTKLQGQLHNKEISDIGMQLAQGDGLLKGQGAFGPQVQSQIDQAYHKGWITAGQRYSMLDQVQRNYSHGMNTATANQMLDDMWHNGTPLDPTDKAMVKASGPYFDARQQEAGNVFGDPNYANMATTFVARGHVMPPSLHGQIVTNLSATDPNTVVYTARLYQQLHDAAPTAAVFDDKDPPKLQAFADAVNTNVHNGMSAVDAVNLARTTTDVTPEVKRQRDVDYAAAQKKASQTGTGATSNSVALQSLLNDKFGHFWAHAPLAAMDMRADFDALTREFYSSTGDLTRAQSLAFDRLTAGNRWGPTTVNASATGQRAELTKWPISDADVPRIRASLADGAKAAGYTGDPAKLELAPIHGGQYDTDVSKGKYWGVHYVDADGNSDALLGPRGGPAIFDRDAGRGDFAEQHRAAIVKQLAAANANAAVRQKAQQASTTERNPAQAGANARANPNMFPPVTVSGQ